MITWVGGKKGRWKVALIGGDGCWSVKRKGPVQHFHKRSVLRDVTVCFRRSLAHGVERDNSVGAIAM